MQRLIEPNHKVQFPRYLVFVDTESTIGKEDISRYSEHKMKMGVAIYVRLDKNADVYQREVFHFFTADEFWDWCIGKALKQSTLTIYGHNLKYDAINLNTIDKLIEHGYIIPYPILDHKFIMRCHKLIGDKRCYKIKLVDTFNFSQFSLKEIGKRFGLEKMEADFENDTDEKLFTYCQRDTEIVEIFILSYVRFLVENDLGSFRDTLAGTSFSTYRHKFLEEIWSHDDREVLAFERRAYFGGRTECWYIGDLPMRDYRVYDVKSMYPHIMKTKQLPRKLIGVINKPSIELIKLYIKDGKYIIAECIIKTDDKIIPYPVRHIPERNTDFPYTSTLLFPRGEYQTYLHSPELEYAIANNHIVSISKIVIYECCILFEKFVNYFYDRKESSTNRVERELSKLTMNSTYGAFGKRNYETELMDIPDGVLENETFTVNLKIRDDDLGYAIVKNMEKRQTYHSWLGTLYRVTADALTPVRNTNVALAGAVTAYARMYLFEMLQICGDRHRYYSDTDSILTDSEGGKRLEKYVGNELGKLELQLDFNHGKINCPKDYEFGDKVRLKGIGKLSKKLSDNVYETIRFTSFKDYIRTGKHGTIVMNKELTRKYNKGIIQDDGFVLSPIMQIANGENIRIE